MSNNIRLDFYGMEEITASLERMSNEALDEVEKESLKKGAEIVRKQQQENWNRSMNDDEHIQDAIRVGRVYGVEDGSKVNIAPKMSLRWRAKFVEYGTSYQAAQRPIERSLSITQGIVAQEMMSVFERMIRL